MLSPVNHTDASAHDGGHPPSSKRTFDGLPVMSLLNLGSLSPANCEDLMWFVSPRASSQRLEASADFEDPIDDFMYFVTSFAAIPDGEDDKEELRQAVISLLLLLKEKGEVERLCFQPERSSSFSWSHDLIFSSSEALSHCKERAPCSACGAMLSKGSPLQRHEAVCTGQGTRRVRPRSSLHGERHFQRTNEEACDMTMDSLHTDLFPAVASSSTPNDLATLRLELEESVTASELMLSRLAALP